MQIKSTLLVFTLSIAATGTLYGDWIFKWTDEDGTVHFSDLPTGAAGEERLEITSRPTDQARVRAEVQAQDDAQIQRAQEAANAPLGPTPEQLRAEALERKEKCSMYRERQTRFSENRRIYRMDENGERVYYDEEEMQAARDNVRDLVAKYCS
jgi:hypothetical protein